MNPNKRLTIVGKFRLNDDKPEYRFCNDGSEDKYPLNPEQLFKTLQPQLCFVPENTKKIGDAAFNAYKILTPLQAHQQNRPLASMRPLAVKPDSPFFKIESDSKLPQYHAIQKEGGRLFKVLLTDLNQVARFYQGKFSKALLKLAKEYLLEYANHMLSGHQIDQAAWYDIFLSHPDLTTTLLKYLTAYPDDVAKIQQQFQNVLQTATEGKAQWIDHGDEYRKALSQALEMCRQALESGDDTLTEIANQQRDMEWLVNYGRQKYQEYNISEAFDEAADNFAHYYQLFRKHSDNLHRFLRSGPLHSFLFCWLASKYQQHSKGNEVTDACQVMYQEGVEGQGKKRLIAESRAEWQDTINVIREAISLDQLPDELRQQINNPDLYEAGSDALGTNLIKTLETTGNFTRRQLVQQCEDLFVETALLVGGAMGDILRQFNDRFDDYMVLYHAILRQQSGSSPDEFKEAMGKATLKAISPPQLDEMTDRIFAELSGVKSCTAQPVKKEFLKVVTEDTQGKYFKAYLEKQGEIEATSMKLREAYRLRLGMDIDAAGNYNTSQIGTAGIATLHEIPDITEHAARQEAQRARLEHQVQPDIPFQTTLREGVPSGEYQIKRENAVIGTATVDDKVLENTLITMSGRFEAEERDTVKEAEQIIAVSTSDDAQRFSWRSTDYEAVGKVLKSPLTDNALTFNNVKLHQSEGEVPIKGDYELQVDGDTVGKATITTETQNNAVPTIAGTLNTDDLDAIASDDKLTLSKGKQNFDWQAKERDDLLPIVREYRGLKPKDVAGNELWQQQAETEKQFEHLVGQSLKDQDDLMMRLHTLVLGEYMLAAPKGAIALDTADLSKMSGMIFDMVRHIGNPNLKELFENQPSSELLDDPKRGLKAINLSKYYPVSKSNELNTVLQYHYEVCGDLLSIREYVRDIDELRRAFSALRHDKELEIRVINQTLEEHVNCTQSNNELLLCNDETRDHHSLFVYLTAQSDAQNGLASLKALMPGDIGVLSQAGWRTQLPLFVAKLEKVKDETKKKLVEKPIKSDAFPLISRKSLALPDISKLNLGFHGVPLLELCLSLMTKVDFGQFSDFTRKIQSDFVKLNKEVEAAGIPEKGQSISEYLKNLWFTHPVLRSHLIFLKWFNLGLEDLKTNENRPANWRLGKRFGKFLKDVSCRSDWAEQAFEGLERIEGKFPLKDFQTNMEPLYGPYDNLRRISQTDSPPGIEAVFGFEISEDNTNQSWPLVNINWKNWYKDKI